MLEEQAEEELAELRNSQFPEQLVDLLEVLHTPVAAYGWDWSEVEALRIQKATEHSGFTQRALLKEVFPVVSCSGSIPDLLQQNSSLLLAAIPLRMVDKYR